MDTKDVEKARKLINQIKIPIRWVDLDAYAHVNNARYFDYMSEARAVQRVLLLWFVSIQTKESLFE